MQVSNLFLHKTTICMASIDAVFSLAVISLITYRLISSLIHKRVLSTGLYIACAVVLSHFIFQFLIALYLRHVAKKNDYYGVRRWLTIVGVIFVILVSVDLSQLIAMERLHSEHKLVIIAICCIVASRIYSVIEWCVVYKYMQSIASTKKCPVQRERYNNQS